MSVFYDLFGGIAETREVDVPEEDVYTMFDTLFVIKCFVFAGINVM